MPTVSDIVDYLERFAPRSLAASWDNVGLLLGERGKEVQRIMTCLTVTPECVTEACREQVDMIVSHHPILFRGAKQLNDATTEGRLLLPLLRAGIAVYSPHTAFDNTVGGINDMIASQLGLREVKPLRNRTGGPGAPCKIVVFVPENDGPQVSDAMFAAGAGEIGAYRECSFRVTGTGTFFGTETSNPVVGERGRREEVSEWRLEMICPEARVERVIAAMRRAHPYEEPAFDVYPLRPPTGSQGEGRLGKLEQPCSLRELAALVKDRLKATFAQMVGDPGRSVQTVAIVCGAGGELLSDGWRARADVFLTGEMRFHDCLTAQQQGIAVILPGHYATERPGVEALATMLQRSWQMLQVWASREETDPLLPLLG